MGKTFEMLAEGIARKRDGVDVVVGVVETHGRIGTVALTRGHEIVPPHAVAYEGRRLDEMDLDAVLARAPRRASSSSTSSPTNAPTAAIPSATATSRSCSPPGSMFTRRSTSSTSESLNDVVTSFTRVRETTPDSVLEQAEIEVVDIPPDELIERLKTGKVYLPAEAIRALGHVFSKSNLSALRELAPPRGAGGGEDGGVLGNEAHPSPFVRLRLPPPPGGRGSDYDRLRPEAGIADGASLASCAHGGSR